MKRSSIVGVLLRRTLRSLSDRPGSDPEAPPTTSSVRTGRRSIRSTRAAVALPQSTGAVTARTPIPRAPIDKPVLHHGKVHVIETRCKECEFCVTFCPEEVLEISDYYTPRGYRPARVKKGKEDACIACRFCEDVCPEYAIYVVEDTP